MLLLQVEPLPNSLATVPTSLTASNLNKQLGRRMSRSASRKQDDQASQGSGHSSASRSAETSSAKQEVCIISQFTAPGSLCAGVH